MKALGGLRDACPELNFFHDYFTMAEGLQPKHPNPPPTHNMTISANYTAVQIRASLLHLHPRHQEFFRSTAGT